MPAPRTGMVVLLMRGNKTITIGLLGLLLASAGGEEEAGFVSLFDGESLEGWVTTGGRYDGHATWFVEDGAIVGRQGPSNQGGLLYTAQKYTSFVLRLEAKIDYPFDSGIFLRMAPEGKGAQITLDHRPGGEIGGIYSDGYLRHNEEGASKFLRDEWNEMEVVCTGFDMHIRFRLNGEWITDYRLPPDSAGYAPTGLIGLQVHGGREDTGSARFRNLRIRPLPIFGEEAFEAGEGSILSLTEAGTEAGWAPLFDGESLDGWGVAGEDGRYRAGDGVLAFEARGGGGQLETAEDYTDFRLRLDFKISKMANSGVFLRAARDGSNPAYSGCEVQILDDFNWEAVTGTELEPFQFTGGLYGSVPSGDPGALNPVGEWNTYEILYRGSRPGRRAERPSAVRRGHPDGPRGTPVRGTRRHRIHRAAAPRRAQHRGRDDDLVPEPVRPTLDPLTSMAGVPWIERTWEFGFPAGLYPGLLERLRGTPARVEETVGGLAREVLTTRRSGGWSIQENVGHLLDLEGLPKRRLDELLAGAETLSPADMSNRATDEAGHHDRPIAAILLDFREARRALVGRLEALQPADFERAAMHPRLEVPMRPRRHVPLPRGPRRPPPRTDHRASGGS